MKHEISADRKTLIISCDRQEKKALEEFLEENETEMPEWEALEWLLGNSELQWVSPEDTGDLTSAPMLGIWGEESRDKSGPCGYLMTGGDEKGLFYTPILERWAFMSYQLRTITQDLRETGRAVLTS